jgi:hypothetical protein
MPLHLLGKKSWNVYAPENIAKVKRDEAEAAAKEEELDRVKDEHDSAVRLALLRGEAPPPPLELEVPKSKRRRDERGPREGKRRRIAGEDDTERDIRTAREDMEERRQAPQAIEAAQKQKNKNDAPITDHAGHINLFPIDPREQLRNEKNAEVEAEKARKKRELEDQYTMRLDNAAGRNGLKEKPWYASSGGVEPPKDKDGHGVQLDMYGEDKNVWGRPDPRRKEREAARIGSSDPLAFMSKAQTQLKNAERDRKKWAEERQREMDALKRDAVKREKREKKRRRRGSEDGVERFNLDGEVKYRERRRRSRDAERRHERSKDGDGRSRR